MKKLLPLTGILAVALAIAAFAVSGETPDADAPVKEVVDFYTNNDTEQMFSGALLAWAAVAFLFFASFLRGVLRRAEKEAGGLSALSFGAAIIFAVGLAIFAAIGFAAGDVADKVPANVDPAALQALNVMNSDFFFPAAVGAGTFFLATGIAVLKTGALPKWLGWFALLFGVVGLTPIGFFAIPALGLFLIITSILFVTRETA
jgi:uncharacterized protein DUF4386